MATVIFVWEYVPESISGIGYGRNGLPIQENERCCSRGPFIIGAMSMKITVGKKLIGGFLLILILLMAIGVISIAKMISMGNDMKAVQQHWLPSVKIVSDIQKD